MHPHDIRPPHDRKGNRGGGAKQALPNRFVEYLPNEGLAACPDKQRVLQAFETVQMIDQRHILRDGLTEPETRIKNDAVARNTGIQGILRQRRKFAVNIRQ